MTTLTETKPKRIQKVLVTVTKLYEVTYKCDPEVPLDEEDIIEETVETWAHDLLVDEIIDGEQLINQSPPGCPVEIISSEHCVGSGDLSLETQTCYDEEES